MTSKMRSGFLIAVFVAFLHVLPSVTATHIIDGDALLAYMEGNRTPPYRTWNGTDNSSEKYALDILNSDPNWVEIATSFTDFTAVMVILDSANDVNAQVWRGSWSNNQVMTLNSRAGDHSFDVAYESRSGRAMVVYNNRDSTGLVRYRIWDGSSWSLEQNTIAVGAEPEDMRLESNPKRDELILITREADSSIDVQVWNGVSWNNQTQVSGASIGDFTPIAVAFETISGDALAVWGDSGVDTPRYRIWNGSAWSATANALSVGGGDTINFIELASHPYTDEITMATIDTGGKVVAQVWNGTAWTNSTTLTGAAFTEGFSADVIYESKKNRSIVVYDDGTNIPKYRIWNGTAWSPASISIVDIGAEPLEIDLASHPNKDEIILLTQGAVAQGGNVHFFVWNTTNWSNKGIIGSGLAPAAQNERKGISAAYVIPRDDPPLVDNITASPTPIKGGTTITITANGVSDPNNGTLQLFVSTSLLPNASNTLCTGGTTSDSTPPYSLTCTFTVETDNANHTVFGRVYDQIGYSHTANTTYTTDSTPPSTSVNNVAGDTSATYIDNVNDGYTNITIDGEANMSCRFHTADVAYSSMPSANECVIIGTQAICPAQPAQGFPDFYVSCRDSLDNEQNTTQNLDVIDLLVDWTAPTTFDNSVTDIQVPTYTVTINESDNVDSDPTTLFCTDTTNTCTPNTAIDTGGQVNFNSSKRGTNYLRYRSADDAGNTQAIQSRTININRLPVLTSASDNAVTIKGGRNVTITTASNESDPGQTLSMYVCSSTGANGSGCTTPGADLCSNTTASANSSCSFTSQTDDGAHSWFVYAFDDLNEGASNNPLSGTYTTDSTPPAITILDPANTTFTQTSVLAQIVLSEAGDVALFSLNGTTNVSMTKVSVTLFANTISGLVDQQQHNITFYANDTVGNMNKSAVVYFRVDTTANDTIGPSILVLSPVNSSFHNAPVLLNISLSENGSAASYSLDGSANQSLGNVSLTLWNATITPSEGLHNVTFYANDTSTNRNTGTSSVVFFTYDVTAPIFSIANKSPSIVNDNANVTCFSSLTDNVRLSVGIVEENSTGNFTNHTISLSGTSGDVNFTISAENLNPGSVICRFYANDTTGNVNTTSISFVVNDATPPNVTNISHSPFTEADLDPNVRINVTATVTDNFNLTSVILQYKEANATVFSNFTMTNTSGNLYEGNFTPNTTNNWTFRILAVDSRGNTNVSAETNLSIAQDKTFLISHNIPSIKSIVFTDNRIINLGNITANDTGDVDLNFTVTANVSWITFNGTVNNTINFSVSNKSSAAINVTANTTGFAVGLYDYSITITGSHENSQIGSSTITGFVNIQNIAGPFLVVAIDTYSASVTKGQTGITLSSSLQNLGTSDASGVWLAWELPSEFILETGTLNRSIGNLVIGASATNTITISVNASADDKTVTISASANSTQGSGDKESRTVTIGTPITITVTQVAAGGGGPPFLERPSTVRLPIYSPAEIERETLFPSLPPLEMLRGTNHTVTIRITNPFENSTLENLSLQITGYPAENLILEPFVAGIGFGEAREFLITIVVPPEEGTVYTLDFVLSGNFAYTDYPTTKDVETGKILKRENVSIDFFETRTMTLIVHSEVFPTYSPTQEEVELLFQAPTAIELVRGTDVVFNVRVINPYPNTFLEDVILKIAGYPAENIKIAPDLINGIGYNEPGEFSVRISAPTYLEKGTYPLDITIEGRIHYPSYPTAISDITSQPLVLRDISLEMGAARTLAIDLHLISRTDARAALSSAEETVRSLRELGFTTNRISRLLSRARLAFGNKDYESAKTSADEITAVKETAISAIELLNETRNGMQQAEELRGLRVTDAKNLFNLALAAFEREDYSTTLQRLSESQAALALETKGKVNWLKLALDYWYAVLLGSLATIGGLSMFYQRAQVAWLRNRREELWAEEANILGLIQKAQTDYYVEGIMSADDYKSATEQYENRLVAIRRAMAELRTKKAGRLGISEDIGVLREERRNLVRLMMQLQERYYNGPISRDEYDKGLESYEARTADVDERIAMFEAEAEKRRRKG